MEQQQQPQIEEPVHLKQRHPKPDTAIPIYLFGKDFLLSLLHQCIDIKAPFKIVRGLALRFLDLKL
jgi:hypothetical protein